MKKVLGNAAVLAALVLFAGACSTAPKEETDFLDAVKGKTATITGVAFKVSADGKTIGEGDLALKFVKAETALKANYVSVVNDQIGYSFVLNADKKGGKATKTISGVKGAESDFTIQ